MNSKPKRYTDRIMFYKHNNNTYTYEYCFLYANCKHLDVIENITYTFHVLPS